eukprot:scaffold203412_cov23-Prasinocladus_malaysianus.AAC.2
MCNRAESGQTLGMSNLPRAGVGPLLEALAVPKHELLHTPEHRSQRRAFLLCTDAAARQISKGMEPLPRPH